MITVQMLKKKWLSSGVYRRIEAVVNSHFQKRLLNDRFTILSSNCIGGTIYHRLGKQFLSPTLNTYLSQPDFISFCVHIRHYLAQELRFTAPEGSHQIVALLPGDGHDIPQIKICFDHAPSAAVAEAEWNRRKTRVQFDNLYIILYDLDGLTLDQIRLLEQFPCNNKVILTSRPRPDIPWSCYIKPVMRHKFPYAYLSKDVFGIRYFEKKFDFVAFLNHNRRIKHDVPQ